jgi:acetyltransferase-like isoleucine patch superfamily enzyme
MHTKLLDFFYAKYRAFAPISCFDSPRSDLLRGWRRWRWLVHQRQAGRLVEPSVRILGNIAALKECLKLGVGIHIDRDVIIWLGSEQEKRGSILLADRVYVGPNAYLGTSTHRLEVGADTLIGAYTYIITENHCTLRKDIPYARQGYIGSDVIIGKNVWIGCHVTILPGVTIGDHVIVGAGAVVTKNIPENETWVGVPAKKIQQ